MKRSWAAKSLLFAIVLLSQFALSDDCSFARVHDQYDPEKAKIDARAAAKESEFKFIGVADGVVPSRPGFEGIQLTKCLVIDAEWELLWVGADSSFCENGKFLKQKANQYAKLFNSEMLRLVSSDSSFVCLADLETPP